MPATLVIGASENPERYAYKAIASLKANGYEVLAIGNKEGAVAGVNFLIGTPDLKNIDTVTLYLSAKNQVALYEYILSLKPRRIIFNPGAENADFAMVCKENGIEILEACTLVMLSLQNY
jgi:predicted CoA-binding protein